MTYQLKFIKQATCLFVLCFIFLTATAQEDSATNLPNFLFPFFMKSFVKFKTGELKTAVVNYNVVDEELVILQDKTYMTLNNPGESIDTLYVGGRVFMPFNKTAFYELFSTGPVNLFMQYKKNAEQEGTTTGYGVKSQTTSAENRKQIYGAMGSVNLALASDIKLTDNDSYWINKDGSMHKFLNKKQFLKIFKDKETEINKYITDHAINFKKISDLTELVNYCNEIYK